MSRCQTSKQRILEVIYGVMVARSEGATVQLSSIRSLVTFVISSAVWKIRQFASSSLNFTASGKLRTPNTRSCGSVPHCCRSGTRTTYHVLSRRLL